MVAVMSPRSTHPAALEDEALLAHCRVERTRASGPGGQRRNKVETAIRLTHLPTAIVAAASERRQQAENLKIALRRLRIKLAVEIRDDPGRQPSDLWTSRTSGGRIAVNPKHDDFPSILAEALDTVALKKWDVAAAAERLGVSSSQLVKLLKVEHAALELVNQQRERRGMHKLH